MGKTPTCSLLELSGQERLMALSSPRQLAAERRASKRRGQFDKSSEALRGLIQARRTSGHALLLLQHELQAYDSPEE